MSGSRIPGAARALVGVLLAAVTAGCAESGHVLFEVDTMRLTTGTPMTLGPDRVLDVDDIRIEIKDVGMFHRHHAGPARFEIYGKPANVPDLWRAEGDVNVYIVEHPLGEKAPDVIDLGSVRASGYDDKWLVWQLTVPSQDGPATTASGTIGWDRPRP